MDTCIPHITNFVDCCFCNEFDSGIMPELFVIKSGLRTRIVTQDSDFVAIPSISPIALGHMLLVPRAHVTAWHNFHHYCL